MTYLRHFLKTLKKILQTRYAYNRIILLFNYLLLISKSTLHHKLLTAKTNIHQEHLLGLKIYFYTYPQLVNLFEEIFIYQVYNFKSKSLVPTIIDCGSNIGLSVLYFKKLYPSAKIVAFEPDKDAYKLLVKNIKENKLSNTLLYNFALSDKIEEVVLHKANSYLGSLTMSLINSAANPINETIQANQLSDYITNSIDFIKIDVEGSEIKIINDLIENQKLKKIDQLIIEYHPSITEIPLEDFSLKIEKNGFLCNHIQDNIHDGATEVIIKCKNLEC